MRAKHAVVTKMAAEAMTTAPKPSIRAPEGVGPSPTAWLLFCFKHCGAAFAEFHLSNVATAPVDLRGQFRVLRLHPAHQRGHHRPLRARENRYARGGAIRQGARKYGGARRFAPSRFDGAE